MKLQRLTGLEKVKLTQELVALELQIKNLKFLLDNEEEKVKLLIDRLNQIKKNYGDERRTEIITDFDETDIDDES